MLLCKSNKVTFTLKNFKEEKIVGRKKSYSLELIKKTNFGYQKITYSNYKKIKVSYHKEEKRVVIMLFYRNGKKEYVTYENIEGVSLKVYKHKQKRRKQ